ncbi:30S ribosomal protein S7 [Candidatus Parcubacteria bacterium]|jgi:small subunit ribosomal protein S7|nr:MAG: 30S ribosomal protein S7 [Candidatus Parcubacteria bacterium]
MHGKTAPKRKVRPDPRYQSQGLAKFINYVMERGKKSVAQKIVYGALEQVEKKTGKKPLDAFDLAIRNVSPVVEVKSRRVGGANYQVPVEVRGERKMALAFRWILEAARNKKGRPMNEKLANEIIAAINNEGDAIKKKQDVHRMAEANRAFAHFA